MINYINKKTKKMKKKFYQSPETKVVNVKAEQMICDSPTGNGGFTLSNSQVGQGSEDVWDDDNESSNW